MITKSIKLIAHKIWKNLEKKSRENFTQTIGRNSTVTQSTNHVNNNKLEHQFLLNFVFENCLKQNILISDFAGSPLVSRTNLVQLLI